MAPELIDAFVYCPLCGAAGLRREGDGVVCGKCGYHDFNNPIAAVAVFIFDSEDRILLIHRAKEPAKGKWAPPGGFINVGETLEQAAVREIAEETGLEFSDLQYLCSFPNSYIYQGRSCPVCDTFFTARTTSGAMKLQQEEVSDFRYVPLVEINPEELAFDSMRNALRVLRQKNSN